jgi:L-ribulokinase
MREYFTLGYDYGTNSVRAVVVNTSSGRVVGQGIYDYQQGQQGILADKNDSLLARQNPIDHIDGFRLAGRAAVLDAEKKPNFDTRDVCGIGISTTGSSPLPINSDGIPLALTDEFRNNLSAYIWLWKDHTSYDEASRITTLSNEQSLPYLTKCGGTYSSEWFWAKIWHCLNVSPEVFKKAYSWVELCDFIPAYVTNNCKPGDIHRSICAAGHKAMFSPDWGGLPSEDFLNELAPELAGLRGRLYNEAYSSDHIAGQLESSWAEFIGIPANIPVAVGGFDVHHGAVGVYIKPNVLVKAIGTSTCDIVVANPQLVKDDIPGICGMVKGSVLPKLLGIEAGQSAVGDIFNWFVSEVMYSSSTSHHDLTTLAKKLVPGESGLLALDWNNGNRTILTDPLLTGLLVGQTLYTKPSEIYRALIEATAFGALMIIRQLEYYGVRIDNIVCCGGIARKNPLMMQIYADVCNRPMHVNKADQACALGSAIFASVAAGIYGTMEEAQHNMSENHCDTYYPTQKNVQVYNDLFFIYKDLHDSFGCSKNSNVDLYSVMKKLIEIKGKALLGKS